MVFTMLLVSLAMLLMSLAMLLISLSVFVLLSFPKFSGTDLMMCMVVVMIPIAMMMFIRAA